MAAIGGITWAEGLTVESDYVQVPGLFSGRCVKKENSSFLAVTVNSDSTDPRADDFRGDLVTSEGVVLNDWGLHLVHVGLAQGDLIKLIRSQAAAHVGK